MTDDEPSRPGASRDAIHAAITDHAAPRDGVLLTRWVLVAEWMDPESHKWLTRVAGAGMATWEVNGLLHEALHGNWPGPAGEPGLRGVPPGLLVAGGGFEPPASGL